jgi:predicted TIM-barrel fold metal-dependent hydrolase
MKTRGATARGVAVIDGQTPESDLDRMDRAGIHATRINLSTTGQDDQESARKRFQAAVERVKRRSWPHPDQIPGRKPTELTKLKQIDDGAVLNQLPVWAPDEAARKKILVDNPATLYGFS